MYKIYTIGSEYHCDLVKNIMKDEKEFLFTNNLKDADLLYAVYGPGLEKKTISYWIFSNKPILIHWIGKDTFIFDKSRIVSGIKNKISRFLKISILKYRNLLGNVKYVSSAPWLANEVETLSKIQTDYFVLTSIEKDLLLKPKKNRIYDFVSYIPTYDFDMYYGNELLEIAKNNPERKFAFVCPDIKSVDEWPFESFENLTIYPRTDKNGFYEILNKSKCFVRLKNGGDAIALSVLEALGHGCKVVWNLEFDYCEFETRDSFKNNYSKYFMDEFNVNEDAIKFVKENYDIEAWKKEFKEIVSSLLNKK